MAHARTRQDVLQALRARRTYATNGPRIFLHVQIDGHLMGSQLPRAPAEAEDEPTPQEQGAVDTQRLEYEAVGTGPIERIDFVRSGHVAAVPGEDRSQLSGVRVIPRLRSGEYVYLRVVQRDGGAAWSSPIYGN